MHIKSASYGLLNTSFILSAIITMTYLKKQHFIDVINNNYILWLARWKQWRLELSNISFERMTHNCALIRIEEQDLKAVVYENTVIWHDDMLGWVILNDGWRKTVTTKKHMNTFLCIAWWPYENRYEVYQKNYVWYIRDKDGDDFEYYSGIRLTWN